MNRKKQYVCLFAAKNFRTGIIRFNINFKNNAMNQILRQMAVMSVALVLFCVSAVAQNEKNSMTNEVKSEITLTSDADDFNLYPDPCLVYKGDSVDVIVELPVGYDDIIFDDFTKSKTELYFTAEICEVNGVLSIRIRGRSDYPDRDTKTGNVTVCAIQRNSEYRTRSLASVPRSTLTVQVMSKF